MAVLGKVLRIQHIFVQSFRRCRSVRARIVTQLTANSNMTFVELLHTHLTCT